MQPAVNETREALVEVARKLFSERGFYGVSVASIASELGITKQALLHYFGTKEALYAEVLSRMSGVYTATLKAALEASLPPEEKVEAFFLGFCAHALEMPGDVRLIMRELLDNKERAGTAGRWYLREFLNDLAGLMASTRRWQEASEAETRAAAYQLLGAISYFAISEPTLERIFGEDGLHEMREVYPAILRETIRSQQM